MPQVNDALRYSTSTSTFDYTTAGANHVWDFSKIQVANQDVQKYNSALSTPYLLQFLSNSSYGIPQSNQSVGPIGNFASNVYLFYKTSAAAQVIVGRGATIQSLPLGIVYAPKDTVFKYPLTFGKTYASNYYGEQSLPTLGTLKQIGSRSTEVDGWGSITTPYGTFDCIRVKSIVDETDSIILTGFGIPFPNNKIEYSWFAKNEKYPIMEVIVNSATSQVTSIKYKDIYRPEAYVNNANFSASKTGGKIGDTITFNNLSFGIPKSYNWTITPNTYQFAAGSSASSENPKVIFTGNGKYSVKLSLTYEGAADDTLRTDYITITEPVVAKFGCSNVMPRIGETVNLYDSSTGSPTSFTWSITPTTGVLFLNGTIAKNIQVQFTQTGNYSVQLKASNAGSTNTVKLTNYIQVWPTGLTRVEAKTFAKIFPNPGKNFIQIELNEKQATQLNLFSILGKVVISKTFDPLSELGINTENLPRGIYFLELKQNGEKFTQRLILE